MSMLDNTSDRSIWLGGVEGNKMQNSLKVQQALTAKSKDGNHRPMRVLTGICLVDIQRESQQVKRLITSSNFMTVFPLASNGSTEQDHGRNPSNSARHVTQRLKQWIIFVCVLTNNLTDTNGFPNFNLTSTSRSIPPETLSFVVLSNGPMDQLPKV